MSGVVTFDLDGTLASSRWREFTLAHPAASETEWRSFFHLSLHDPVIPETASALIGHHEDPEWTIVILTGRPFWHRLDTRKWLAHHRIPYHQLVMRSDLDRSPARAYKGRALDWISSHVGPVRAAYDDDRSVLPAFRERGIPVNLVSDPGLPPVVGLPRAA